MYQTGKWMTASIRVLEGAVHFKTNNHGVLLKTGGLLTLHEQVKHVLTAAEESVILLTMTSIPSALSPA
jgi:quercetin dioxygenase-like cupin family protein